MKASINIIVMLCVVIKEAQLTNYTEAKTDRRNESNNRHRRQQDSSPYSFPSKCNRAILSCCADTADRQKKCFSNLRCAQTYDNGNACTKDTILKVLDSFDVYANNKQVRRKRLNYYENSQPRFQSVSDSNLNQQEQYFPEIVRLLEELTTYVKNPQTVPIQQPIYFPYPIPYPVPQSVQQTTVETDTEIIPDIQRRGFPIDAATLGWVNSSGDDGKDGARPINFVPIKPDQHQKRLAPTVERGTVQAEVKFSASSQMPASAINKSPPKAQSPCTSAILACCAEKHKQVQANCFYSFQCGIPYDDGNACKSDSIRAAVDLYNSTHLG